MLMMLASCTQFSEESRNSVEPTQEVTQLFARAMGDEQIRLFLASKLEVDREVGVAEIKNIHTPDMYEALAGIYTAQGIEASAAVTKVRGTLEALPYAFIAVPVNYESWNPRTQIPLVTNLGMEESGADTTKVLLPDLTTRTISAETAPDEVVFVLHEVGERAAQMSLSAQAAEEGGVSCTKEEDLGHVQKLAPKVWWIRQSDNDETYTPYRYSAKEGWTIYDYSLETPSIYRDEDWEPIPDNDGNVQIRGSKNGQAVIDSEQLVRKGGRFVTKTTIEKSYDWFLDAAGSLSVKDLEAKLKAELKRDYEEMVEYTYSEFAAEHDTLEVVLYARKRWARKGAWLYLDALIKEMCVSAKYTSEGSIDSTFSRTYEEVTGQKPPIKGSEVTFNVSLSNVYASLTIKGNGKTYLAYHGKKLVLAPGAYTISGSGYDPSTGQQYVAVSQTINVASDKNMSAYIYMQPQ